MDGIRRHLSYANAAATLALVLAMSGGALAASGSFSSGGRLQACVNNEGALRLLKSGKHCARSQKTIAWNQTGPAGSQGATGASGPAGAPGATGPKGEKGPEGEEGPSGEPTNVKWAAVVNTTPPKILGGQGVEAVAVAGGNHFAVAFDSDITKCAVVASQEASQKTYVYVEKRGTEADVYLTSGETPVLSPFSIIATC